MGEPYQLPLNNQGRWEKVKGIQFRCNECNRVFILNKQEYIEAIDSRTYITCPYDDRHKDISVECNCKCESLVSELGKSIGIKSTRKQNRYGK